MHACESHKAQVTQSLSVSLRCTWKLWVSVLAILMLSVREGVPTSTRVSSPTEQCEHTHYLIQSLNGDPYWLVIKVALLSHTVIPF